MPGIWAIVPFLILFTTLQAVAQDRFVSKLKLPTGQTVVVAEGDFEARSIGSFSIKLYDVASAPDETTFFLSGLVRPRDGVVEKAILADVAGDQHPEAIVVVRSVGTGSYLSAHAFAIAKDELVLRGAIEGLAPDADPVAALRTSIKKHE